MGETPVSIGRSSYDEQTETESYSFDEAEGFSPEVEQKREEIEQTRAEMGETIEALRDRLSPSNLVQEAKESVREATIGRAGEAVQHVSDSARDAITEAGRTAKGAGNMLLDTIRENPLPSALIGLGAGWLYMSSRQSGEAYGRSESRMSGRLGGAAAEAKERIGEISEETRHKAYEAREGFSDMLERNPLGVGAIAMALGAAVGFAVPETRQEQRLMGETRDRLASQVTETAQDMAEKVSNVASEAVSAATDTARHEAQNQGLTPQ